MDISVQFLDVDMCLFLLGIYLGVELLDCMFNILKNCQNVFPNVSFYILTNKRVPVFYIPTNTSLSSFLILDNGCEVVSHYVSGL